LGFWLLVLAHVIADFLLQGRNTARKKDQGRLSGYILHAVLVLGTFLVLFAQMLHPRLVLTLTVLSLLHIGQDAIKGFITRKLGSCSEAIVFLVDQGLHLLVLLCYWVYWLPINGSLPVVRWSLAGVLPEPGRSWFMQTILPMLNEDLVITLAIFIAVIYGGAVFVRKILDTSPVSLSADNERSIGRILDTGRYIGMVERMILLIFIAMDAFGAVAFVLTAKSIARYQELNQKEFAEYYLVGTLSSTAVALLGGVLLRYLYSLS
jgi:hypothetical protein